MVIDRLDGRRVQPGEERVAPATMPSAVREVPVGAGRAAAKAPTSQPALRRAEHQRDCDVVARAMAGRTRPRLGWLIWNHFGAVSATEHPRRCGDGGDGGIAPGLPAIGARAFWIAFFSSLISVASW